MDKQTLKLHKTECSKCEGDGQNYLPSIHELLVRWRKQQGIRATVVCAFLGCDGSTLSKFENGHEGFSEARIRKYIFFLDEYKLEEK